MLLGLLLYRKREIMAIGYCPWMAPKKQSLITQLDPLDNNADL